MAPLALVSSCTARAAASPTAARSAAPSSTRLAFPRGIVGPGRVGLGPRAARRVSVRIATGSGSPAGSGLSNPFGDCPERDESEAYRSVAMKYFSIVGEKEPDLRAVMTDTCRMTDRVLGWFFNGREQVEEHFRDFADRYCHHEFSHLDVLTNIKERTVCAHWALTVVIKNKDGSPCSVERNGSHQISGVHIFTLDKDNKICNIVTYRTECSADALFSY